MVLGAALHESLVWLNLGLNPGLPDHWQILYSLGQLSGFMFSKAMLTDDGNDSTLGLSFFNIHITQNPIVLNVIIKRFFFKNHTHHIKETNLLIIITKMCVCL